MKPFNKEAKRIENNDDIGRIIHEEIVDEFCENFVTIGKDDTCLPEYYLNYSEEIAKLDVRDSDVIVASFPKTGTTWTQEMVWLIGNDLDYKGAEAVLDQRFPHIELCTLFDFSKMNKKNLKRSEFVENSVQYVKEQPSPRFIKTHLPLSLLPEDLQNGTKTAKIIYVMRNPKDTCVSYYHHGKILQGWRADFSNFSKLFMSDKVMYGPFWSNALGYWEKRNSPNFLFIFYEDMKKDLAGVVKKVASFLGKELNEEQMESLLKHLSFESMKRNNSVNHEEVVAERKKNNLILEDGSFIRSGTVGSHKAEMSEEISKQFDEWTERKAGGTSLKQYYDELGCTK